MDPAFQKDGDENDAVDTTLPTYNSGHKVPMCSHNDELNNTIIQRQLGIISTVIYYTTTHFRN